MTENSKRPATTQRRYSMSHISQTREAASSSSSFWAAIADRRPICSKFNFKDDFQMGTNQRE
jgi:hypothetical protein